MNDKHADDELMKLTLDGAIENLKILIKTNRMASGINLRYLPSVVNKIPDQLNTAVIEQCRLVYRLRHRLDDGTATNHVSTSDLLAIFQEFAEVGE